MNQKRIYVAGPMRGIPEFNFPMFRAAAISLRADGHEVFSPAEADNEIHGTNIGLGNENGDEAQAEKEHGFSLRDALGRDTAWICANATAIYLLPDWEWSKGARAELALAEALGLEVLFSENPEQ